MKDRNGWVELDTILCKPNGEERQSLEARTMRLLLARNPDGSPKRWPSHIFTDVRYVGGISGLQRIRLFRRMKIRRPLPRGYGYEVASFPCEPISDSSEWEYWLEWQPTSEGTLPLFDAAKLGGEDDA